MTPGARRRGAKLNSAKRAAQFVSPANMARWSEVADFVEKFCARHAIARMTMLHLTLVVEELFTNAAGHGRAGGDEVQIRLELGVAQDALELLFEDTGPAFDPLARAREQPPVLDGPADAREPGGLGLHLVVTLADSARYAREDGCNRLRLTLALAPGGDQPGS